MTTGRRSLRVALLLALGMTTAALAADRAGLIQDAQAQSDEDKKKERERKRPSEKGPPPQPPKGPPPHLKMPPAKAPSQQQPAPPEQPRSRFQQSPKQGIPTPKAVEPAPTDRQPRFKRVEPPNDKTIPPVPKGPPVQQGVAPNRPFPPAAKSPTTPAGPAISLPGPKRFEDVRKERRERIEDGGRRKVIQEPGNRTIVKEGNRAVIRHDEAERFARRPGAKSERRGDGSVETFYVRSDGVRIVTVVDSRGRLLRRYRRDRNGREYNIIDNRRFYRNLGVGVGIGVLGGIIALNLSPPRITIPRDRYIVEYDRASDDDLYVALEAPLIEDLDRAYSLEEIRDNYALRARVRRIDLDTINFEFGAWEVGPDQYHKLERIARAILRLLDHNPQAVVMIEGHTDAVGTKEDNLSLADRRASAVAEVLTEEFDVPPENLVTQGYGEEHLKVDTQGPERLNRRVTVLNITGLMAER